MNKLFYYSALFLATTLLGCSNEQGDGALDPDYLEPGTSLIQVSLNYPTAAGYALGDVDTGAGTAAEKEIRTLAFFIKTSHTFGKFFSDALPGSANGFTEALTEVEPGKYTASFLIRSARFDGTCEVIAIANYAESGLDFSEIGTMKKLHQETSNVMDGTKNVLAPLLMYGTEPTLKIISGEPAPLTMEMERAVARIDVINLASEEVPAEGFILESVRMLNAPSQTLLRPVALLQQYTGVDFVAYEPEEGVTYGKHMYLYETENNTEQNRPFIEIKGLYKGAVLFKKIPFRMVEKGIPGEYFPIMRNYRYVLNINKTGDTEDLAFDMIVKDWDTGEDIIVMPSMKAPKLENFLPSLGIEQGVDWNVLTRTLTLTKTLTEPISLSFDASAFQDPKFGIVKADEASAEFIQKAYVTLGELTGYASESVASKTTDITPDENEPMPLRRHVTLTIPVDFNEKVAVVAGSTHTNTLNFFVTPLFSTPITIKYVDERQDAVPVLEGLEGFTAAGGATWDADTKTLNITDATTENVFDLVVRGMQDNDVTLVSAYDANPTSLAKQIVVDKNELVGYVPTDGFLTRAYKVTVPAIKATDKCPSSTQITFVNTANKEQKTTITVNYAPPFISELKSSDNSVVINQATKLVDLTPAASGTTPTVSFFASASAGAELIVTTVNEGTTNNFFTVSKADELDQATIQKYGQGTRVTITPQALTDNLEKAVVSVTYSTLLESKIYIKSVKKAKFESQVFAPNAANTLATGTSELYLAVRGKDVAYGSIVYTVLGQPDEVIAISPQATYVTNTNNPTWATTGLISKIEHISPDEFYQISKRTVTVTLPKIIDNPVAVSSFTVGISGETPIKLIPVYPSGSTIAETDKLLQPLLYRDTWWSPVNVGQTVISKVGDNVSNGGNLFQWGRLQPLTHESPEVVGPVISAAEVGPSFITSLDSPWDWLSTKNDNLWNSGTEAAPEKTDNDPCPSGWRVPTKLELDKLVGAQTWSAGKASALSAGLLTVSATIPSGAKICFSAIGSRSYNGDSRAQGTEGCYWSSAVDGTNASYLTFKNSEVSVIHPNRTNGLPVRCVQD